MAIYDDIPYWLRCLGRQLRATCDTPRQLSFPVRHRLLNLVRREGAVRLLNDQPSLF